MEPIQEQPGILAVGEPLDPIVTGWGAKSWDEPGTTWNDLGDQQVDLTGPRCNLISWFSINFYRNK